MVERKVINSSAKKPKRNFNGFCTQISEIFLFVFVPFMTQSYIWVHLISQLHALQRNILTPSRCGGPSPSNRLARTPQNNHIERAAKPVKDMVWWVGQRSRMRQVVASSQKSENKWAKMFPLIFKQSSTTFWICVVFYWFLFFNRFLVLPKKGRSII